MKRTCIRCGKSEYVRLRKNISEYCRVCQKYFNHQKSRIKKIQNHKCVNCGKNIKPNRCPHCNEIIDYKYRCKRCLSMINKNKNNHIELQGRKS